MGLLSPIITHHIRISPLSTLSPPPLGTVWDIPSTKSLPSTNNFSQFPSSISPPFRFCSFLPLHFYLVVPLIVTSIPLSLHPRGVIVAACRLCVASSRPRSWRQRWHRPSLCPIPGTVLILPLQPTVCFEPQASIISVAVVASNRCAAEISHAVNLNIPLLSTASLDPVSSSSLVRIRYLSASRVYGY